jgi:AcrR family transcriptional regulator
MAETDAPIPPETGPPEKNPADRAIDALLTLVEGRGWRHVALIDVASEAGLGLGALYALFPSKVAILAGFVRRIDAAAFAAGPAREGSVRDKLFDLLMRRFDALKPHRGALKELARGGLRDCALPLCMGPRFVNAMRWTADAAGIETSGLLGRLRVKGVAAAYLWAFRVFLDDDGDDLARTMAALDRALSRCEMLAQSLPGGGRKAASA